MESVQCSLHKSDDEQSWILSPTTYVYVRTAILFSENNNYISSLQRTSIHDMVLQAQMTQKTLHFQTIYDGKVTMDNLIGLLLEKCASTISPPLALT